MAEIKLRVINYKNCTRTEAIRSFKLDLPVTIGRERPNDISPEHLILSRFHGEIAECVNPGQAIYTDLDSANGTRYARRSEPEHRIQSESVYIRPGDVLRVVERDPLQRITNGLEIEVLEIN